jgi:hypothetical protein
MQRKEENSSLGHLSKIFQNGNLLAYMLPHPDSETNKNTRLDSIKILTVFPFSLKIIVLTEYD